MIHIRTDNNELNKDRQFGCGIGPELPEGDIYYFEGEGAARFADCPGCNPSPRKLGTPISQLSGTIGDPGYEAFKEIARTWGYD